MQNTKLIQLLKTFNQSEFKQFGDFINSPFYNKNKNVIALFNFLKKYYPDFNHKNFNDENAFKKLFPETDYDYFTIKNIISDLLSLGKEFLAVNYFRNKSMVKENYLLEEFRDRDLGGMFEQLYKSVLKKYTDNKIHDEFYYLRMHELSEELKNYYTPIKPNSHFNLFQDQLNYFLKYSIIRTLRLYNTMLHENKQNNYTFEFRMFDEVFSYLKNNPDENDPVILLYYNIILLEKENDEKYFFKLKKIFSDNFDKFSNFDKYMYYLHMSGFCADRFNKECKTDFTHEHFLLSKDNFDKGTMELGKILYMDFMNHVKIAVRVNEFEWAEEYIKRYQNSLSEEHKKESLNFCYAVINFKIGNYEKALDLMSQVNFSNFIIKVQVKNFLLQVNYELGYFEQALSMIDNFRHYLIREKNILDSYKLSFSEYLKLTSDLIKYKTGISSQHNKHTKALLIRDVENLKYNQFGIRLWLLEKINEL